MRSRPPALLVVAIVFGLVAAIPTLAAVASQPPGHAKDKDKDKANKAAITLTGTIEGATDSHGKATYSMTSNGKKYTLEAGPPWFFGDHHPLKPYVGKSVTVVGEVAEGSTEVDVQSVNGTALRAPGKPPWAGGWKRVGSIHPGWSQDKADRMQMKSRDCFPPGQCKAKDKAARGADEPDESDEPEASEVP
jgi:hypothetical protein